jgi:hypothetical protein
VSAAPDLALWLHALLVLAAGGTVLVGLAAVVAGVVRSAAGRRLTWQAATLALAGLFLSEVTGLAGPAGAWLIGTTDSPRRVAAPPESAPAVRVASVPVPEPEVEAITPETSALREPLAESSEAERAVWWPGLAWLAGAVLVAGRAGLARLLLVAFRRRHRPCADAALPERVRSVAQRLGQRRAVLVLEAGGLRGPVAFGVVRPTIALPAGFGAAFAPPQQEAMLAHELAHLAAGDPAWHLLADLATAALWWHPLAWWARQQLRAAAEVAADEASLVVADGPGVLAACLVELGGRVAASRSAGWVRIEGSGFRSGLGRRVERLLRLHGAAWRPPGRLRWLLTLTLGPTALVAAAVLSTAWAQARAFPEGDTDMQRPWKRSLAALVLVAALGSDTSPARSGDTPVGGAPPPTGAPAAEASAAPPAAPERPDVRQLQKALQRLAEQIADMEKKKEDLEKRRQEVQENVQPQDPLLQKLEAQLEQLNAQADELQKKKADLEAEIKARQDQMAAAAGPHLKVFRLKYRDPEEMRDVLSTVLANRDANAAPPAARMGPAPGGLAPFGGGGGLGGFVAATAPTWRVAADPRARCLIVRGMEPELQIAADLVTTLDVAEGKAAPQAKTIRVFHLRFAHPEGTAEVLQALGINAIVVAAPKAGALVVSGSPEALKEVSEVIDALDVEGKPADKEKPKGGGGGLFGK